MAGSEMAKRSMGSRTLPYYFPNPPVQSRPEVLPLHDPNWTWGQFEAFCRDLVRHYPGVVRCHHYGKGGSRQKGIDLYADFENGERWTFQCKQRKEFKEADVDKTIAKNSYVAARHIILVSNELGSEARDACDKQPGWDAWDVRDISAEVRALLTTNPDAARRIVEDHFGRHWRSAFLGLRGLAVFLSPYDFFEKFLNPKHVFNHTYNLVGREDQVTHLSGFVESGEHRIAIVRGRGGIGKTKLLHSFSQGFGERHTDFALRFVPDGVPITPESSDELADSPLVVVVDDAHRRDRTELGILFAIAQQRKKPLKLILSLRPNGYDTVRDLLVHAGFDMREVAPVIDLKDLDRAGVKALAAQVLGKNHPRHVDRLAEVTKDCPLITVIAGRLLVERAVSPELLERQDEFREVVLSKFRDEIVGKVSDQIDRTFCQLLLRLISAIMPVGPIEGTFGTSVAEFLKTETANVVEAIGHLEEIGVVYKRGNNLRITPDVLADHILHNACLTSQGRQTGFIRTVFEAFGGVCPSQLLRNLAELDWRVNGAAGDEKVDLLSEVWVSIMREFATADASARLRILDVLTDFSLYQPRRVLEIVEFAIRNPTGEVADENKIYQMRHEHVLTKLPELLRRVVYCSFECLPRACELLWALGKDDDRPQNSTSDHPLRVLADLAGYDIEKPVAFNEAVLRCIEGWVHGSDSEAYAEQLCKLIDPFMEKVGESSHSEGHVIHMQAFPVHERNTRHLRTRAVALLVEKYLLSDNPKSVMRAIKSFAVIIDNPMPLFGMKITDEDCQVWASEQLHVLDTLERFLGQNKLAIATLKALGSLRWAAHQNRVPEVREKARRLHDSVTPDFPLQLTELLLGYQGRFHEDDDFDGDVMASIKRREQRSKELSLSVAKQIVQDYPDPRDGLRLLSEYLELVQLEERYSNPATLLVTIAEVSLDYSYGLCEAILESPGRSLACRFDMIVTPIRRSRPEQGLELLRRALNSEHPLLWSGVASFYYHPSWIETLCDEDIRLIETLLNHQNLHVRRVAIGALWNLGQVRPETAKRLSLSLNCGGDSGLAEELFQRLEMGIGVSLDKFTDEEIDSLIGKLDNVNKIDDYWINQFLVFASKRRPMSVLRLLLHRLDTFEWNAFREVRALPILGFNQRLDGLPQHPDYEEMLREVRDRTLSARSRNSFLIPQLFREITLNFSADCLAVLDEWLETGDEDKVESVAYLLKEAPPTFVFTQTEFVSKLLGIAHSIGDKCFRTVGGRLQSPSLTEGKQGVPGQPFPQDLALRERASAMAAKYQGGSPQCRFYDSLAKHAEHSIKESLLRDAELE